jgi:hypothetical protein
MPKLERPTISETYKGLLKKADPQLKREAIKHEWEWNGYADKMEKRLDN